MNTKIRIRTVTWPQLKLSIEYLSSRQVSCRSCRTAAQTRCSRRGARRRTAIQLDWPYRPAAPREATEDHRDRRTPLKFLACKRAHVPNPWPHLSHDGVDILCKDDALEERLPLDPVLWCRPNQNNQHGLTGHKHLKHTGDYSHTDLLRDWRLSSQLLQLPKEDLFL